MRWRIAYIWILLIGILWVLLLAACGDRQVEQETPLPTFTLIPPTATPTGLPPTSTPTPQPTPTHPLAVLPPQPTIPLPQILSAEITAIVEAALADAEAYLELPAESLHLLGLKAMRWVLPELDCDDAGMDALATLFEAGAAGYRVIVGDEGRDLALVYHADSQGNLLRCEGANLLDQHGTPLYADFLAEEVAGMAREDLARRLAVPAAGIRAVDVLTVTWTDTSLGCPQAGVDTLARLTPGYRILLEYDGQYYPYHADFFGVQFCPLEREKLPPPFDPTPMPQAAP